MDARTWGKQITYGRLDRALDLIEAQTDPAYLRAALDEMHEAGPGTSYPVFDALNRRMDTVTDCVELCDMQGDTVERVEAWACQCRAGGAP